MFNFTYKIKCRKNFCISILLWFNFIYKIECEKNLWISIYTLILFSFYFDPILMETKTYFYFDPIRIETETLKRSETFQCNNIENETKCLTRFLCKFPVQKYTTKCLTRFPCKFPQIMKERHFRMQKYRDKDFDISLCNHSNRVIRLMKNQWNKWNGSD